MNDARDRKDAAIRAALRRGDPAGDGREPDAVEIARWRRRILDAVPARAAAAWRPSLAMLSVAAVLIVAFAGVALWNGAGNRQAEDGRIASEVAGSRSIGAAESSDMAGSSDPAGSNLAVRSTGDPGAEVVPRRPARKVEFMTEGGTRIVWILNPDLQI